MLSREQTDSGVEYQINARAPLVSMLTSKLFPITQTTMNCAGSEQSLVFIQKSPPRIATLVQCRFWSVSVLAFMGKVQRDLVSYNNIYALFLIVFRLENNCQSGQRWIKMTILLHTIKVTSAVLPFCVCPNSAFGSCVLGFRVFLELVSYFIFISLFFLYLVMLQIIFNFPCQ